MHYNETAWWEILVPIVIIILIIFSFNTCSAPDWNDGEYPKCYERYEMRGVSSGLKYYVCPDCGKEVQRY